MRRKQGKGEINLEIRGLFFYFEATMPPDWLDNFIVNEGYDKNNRAFSFTKPEDLNQNLKNSFMKLFMEVIRKCSKIEKEVLTQENFKKLKIIVVNECCFDTISRWMEPRYNSAKYEYIILCPYSIAEKREDLIKHKIAHELAHFFFTLKGNSAGEKECNGKTEEWGFPQPNLKNKNE